MSAPSGSPEEQALVGEGEGATRTLGTIKGVFAPVGHFLP